MPKKIYFNTQDRVNQHEGAYKAKFDLTNIRFDRSPTKIQVEEISIPNILQITEENNNFTFRTRIDEADPEEYTCNVAYLKQRTIFTVDTFIVYLLDAITNSVNVDGDNPSADEIPTIEYVESTQTFSLVNEHDYKFSFPEIQNDAPCILSMIGLSERTMTTLSLSKVKQSEGTRTSIGIKTIYFNIRGLDIEAYTNVNHGTKVSSIFPLYSRNNCLKYPQTETMIFAISDPNFLKNIQIEIVDSDGKFIAVGNFEFSLFMF